MLIIKGQGIAMTERVKVSDNYQLLTKLFRFLLHRFSSLRQEVITIRTTCYSDLLLLVLQLLFLMNEWKMCSAWFVEYNCITMFIMWTEKKMSQYRNEIFRFQFGEYTSFVFHTYSYSIVYFSFGFNRFYIRRNCLLFSTVPNWTMLTSHKHYCDSRSLFLPFFSFI